MPSSADRVDAIKKVALALKNNETKTTKEISNETGMRPNRVNRALDDMISQGRVANHKLDHNVPPRHYRRTDRDLAMELLREKVERQESIIKEANRSEEYNKLLDHSRSILPGAIALSHSYGGQIDIMLMKRDLTTIGLTGRNRDGTLDLTGTERYMDKVRKHIESGYPSINASYLGVKIACERFANQDKIVRDKVRFLYEADVGLDEVIRAMKKDNQTLSDEVIRNQILNSSINLIIDESKRLLHKESHQLGISNVEDYEASTRQNIAQQILPDVDLLKQYESDMREKIEDIDGELVDVVTEVIAGAHLRGECNGCRIWHSLIQAIENIST